MNNQPHSIETLIERTKSYAETRFNIIKLKAVDKTSDVAATVISYIAAILVFFVVFIFVNIGIAYWLGKLAGGTHYGFFIVGGFYAVIGFILLKSKEKWIKIPIANGMINKLFD
jgi:ABC-type multidrug transport system permease subunit